ncbi:MAG: agmatinase [Pseudomonadota bacterium]
MGLEDAAVEVDGAFTRKDLKGLGYEATFAGATSFLRRRYTKDLAGVDIAVTGVPFDQAVTNRPGTRLGPRAVREASALLPFDKPLYWPDYSPLEEFALVDYGDVAFDYARVPDFPDALTEHIRTILKSGASSLAIGGDHFVTYPILRAYAEKHGPLALLQFDAHSDTWADDIDGRIDHGTMFYKAVKEGLIDPARSAQIGIRTHNEDTLGITTITAREVHEARPAETAARLRDLVGDHPVYLTFDIDCLDPAFAPGTGTPVWGGLASWQAAAILRDLAGINLVGGDMVEVSPPFDTTGATAVAGAHVLMELICLWGWTRRAVTPS